LDIDFEDPKFEKQCNRHKLLKRKQGPVRADKIRQRLDDLRAASVLADMWMLPGRCHELHGTQSGQFSLDLDHPYRLILEPAHNPIPKKPDGSIDIENITAVRIIGVKDTHE
jgi:proteic killer suppression protein